MKKTVLLFTSLVFCFTISAQSNNDFYIFPLKPGMEKWKNFKSGKEMSEACDISESLISNFSTKVLVKACIDYPLKYEIFNSNSLQTGIEKLAKNFKGLDALLKREDSGKELFKIYKAMNIGNIDESLSNILLGEYVIELLYIELLLSQPEILSKLSLDQKIEIAKHSLQKYEAKKEKLKIFGNFGLLTCATLMTKILQSENNNDNNTLKPFLNSDAITFFIKTGIYNDPIVLTDIVNATKKFIN